MIAQVEGGGWGAADFAPGNGAVVVGNDLSVQKLDLHWLGLASGKRDNLLK
jgi:hypothetical protein